MRDHPTVFGEVADVYDDVRPGYPDDLVAAVLSYAGVRPGPVVEIGAGTGKATEAFVRAGVPVRCVEADARMAAVLRSRFDHRLTTEVPVEVDVGRFEDWSPPPGGVRLLYCAQAWHWMDPARRGALAHAALAPGGTVALFEHTFGWADPQVGAAVEDVLRERAPELIRERPVDAPPEDHWLTRDLVDCGLFDDVRARAFALRADYPTERYLRLVRTFSPVRQLPAAARAALLPAVGAAVDAAGGVVGFRLDTVLALGRRPA